MGTGDVTLNDVQLIKISLNGLRYTRQLDRRPDRYPGMTAAQHEKKNQREAALAQGSAHRNGEGSFLSYRTRHVPVVLLKRTNRFGAGRANLLSVCVRR